MLHASKPLTSGKVQSYYRFEYSAASNSYFSQGGTLRGEWHGQLATALSLSGVVSAQAFDRLAEGQHPATGEQLIKHPDGLYQCSRAYLTRTRETCSILAEIPAVLVSWAVRRRGDWSDTSRVTAKDS